MLRPAVTVDADDVLAGSQQAQGSSPRGRQVDLGQVLVLDRFRAASPGRGFPAGYRLKLSADGHDWHLAAEKEQNWSNVDVAFAPCPARYARLEQTGQPSWTATWVISEVTVSVAEPWAGANASHYPDDADQAMDTRLRTALAWLERAGLLERNQNLTQVFQGKPLVKNLDEARRKIAGLNLSPTQRRRWLAILQALMNADLDRGFSADELVELPELKEQRDGFPVFRPKHMTPEQLFEGWQSAWKIFYSGSSILKRAPRVLTTSKFGLLAFFPVNLYQRRLTRLKILGGNKFFMRDRRDHPASRAAL